ncbi:MAG: outer membrane lipoprotein-sorting protein [Planctomycetota bacterium]|jgi:outer membrane lipoprotein-sorting protein
MRSTWTAAFVLGFSLPLIAGDKPTEEIPDVQTIVNKANIVAYYQGKDGKATVKMTITNKQGQKRLREFNILRKDVADGGDQKYFVYFQKPPDVRKMVYLVHKHAEKTKDDDRWLYMPGLDLVRRIAASDKRTSFVGSDFLYEDISGRSLDDDSHELIETTDKLFVVKNVPKEPDAVEFGYYNVSIERKSFVPVKMEFYDKKDTLYRVIELVKIEKIQGFPTVVKSVVSNLKTGSKTEMEFSKVKYDIKLKDSIFTDRYLKRPPREAMR